MSLRTFLHNTKPSSAVPLAGWLFSTGARSACKETVYEGERETGLEPATACLEGRNSTLKSALRNMQKAGCCPTEGQAIRFRGWHVAIGKRWSSSTTPIPSGFWCPSWKAPLPNLSCIEGNQTILEVSLASIQHDAKVRLISSENWVNVTRKIG
jgi:hypothetical protein